MKYEDITDNYIQLVHDSINNVNEAFFEIKTAKGVNLVRRERVFCYELYHQMRCLQEIKKSNEFSINAEIDKNGHSIITQNFNPDIVIHKQGEMTNYCVIEVKTNSNKVGILKDFETIKCMLHCYNYKFGIFIMTGKTLDWFKQNLLKELNHPHLVQNYEKIFLLLKQNKKSEIEIATLKELKESR